MDAPAITYQDRPPVALVRCSPLLSLALGSGENAADGTEIARGALALACCWPGDVAWPAPLRPRAWRVGESVLARGQEIFDALHPVWTLIDRDRAPHTSILADDSATDEARAAARAALSPLPIRDLISACYAALAWARSGVLSQADLDAARDFSAAPSGG